MSLWNQPDETVDSETTLDFDTSRLELGIDILDKRLGGGVAPGNLVSITGSPASQSEEFLYELAEERPTLYLATERSAKSVRAGLPENHQAVVVDLDAVEYGHVLDLVDAMPERAHLIVDHVGPFEAGSSRWRGDRSYREFLGELRELLDTVQGVAYLHCLDGRATHDARDTTYHLADAVFELSTRREGDSIEHQLAVPKFRGGALDDVIRLDMSSGVEVDFSRNIV